MYIFLIFIIIIDMQDIKVELISKPKLVDIIYFVKKGDSLVSISSRFNIDKEQIILDNNLKSSEVEEGDILWIRKKNTATYVVKPLDTLENIAEKFNVTVEHIKQVNSIKNVYIGQKIYI